MPERSADGVKAIGMPIVERVLTRLNFDSNSNFGMIRAICLGARSFMIASTRSASTELSKASN